MNEPQVEIKMTSLEMAEIVCKQHAHVMRDIRNEIDNLGEIGQSIFGETSYRDQWNREQPCYIFGRKGAMQLALKYDAKTRFKVIEKLEELEKAQIPTGQNLLALAVIEAQRVLEQKDKLITEMKPKADFFDAVADSKTAVAIGDVAKVIGIQRLGRNKLFEILREKKILMPDNKPYQKYIDNGYFRVIEQKYTKPDGETVVSFKTLVYQRGIDYIRKIVA